MHHNFNNLAFHFLAKNLRFFLQVTGWPPATEDTTTIVENIQAGESSKILITFLATDISDVYGKNFKTSERTSIHVVEKGPPIVAAKPNWPRNACAEL